MKENRKICIGCLAYIIAFLLFFTVQMRFMGVRECLFFDAKGLPTLLNTLCGVAFGVTIFFLGKKLDTNKTALRKMCRVIGILELAAAIVTFVMVRIIASSL